MQLGTGSGAGKNINEWRKDGGIKMNRGGGFFFFQIDLWELISRRLSIYGDVMSIYV
jgi:hypothetical protein